MRWTVAIDPQRPFTDASIGQKQPVAACIIFNSQYQLFVQIHGGVYEVKSDSVSSTGDISDPPRSQKPSYCQRGLAA